MSNNNSWFGFVLFLALVFVVIVGIRISHSTKNTELSLEWCQDIFDRDNITFDGGYCVYGNSSDRFEYKIECGNLKAKSYSNDKVTKELNLKYKLIKNIYCNTEIRERPEQ